MKKIFALLLAILMITLPLASCERGQSGIVSNPNDSETQQQVIQSPNNNIGGNETTDNNGNNGNNGNIGDENNTIDEDENSSACTHEGGEDATCVTESVCDLCNQPYGGFDSGAHEGEPSWVSTDSTHRLAYSCCGKEVEAEDTHTFVDGVCSVCEYACENHDSDGHNCKNCGIFITHSYQNNQCSVCGLIRNGNKIIFGSYPQSKVTDSSLSATLNSSSGTWILNNGTWYLDVESGENKYRGVKTAQNGAAVWFKYEPISWTVLEEKDGKALVLCDKIIEIMAFDESNSNHYAESTIRAWLNETFVNTVFDELLQSVIITTEVDNGNASTGYTNARFTCENTLDKIFLLSRAELKNTAYGFVNDGLVQDSARKKQASEYAIARLNGGYDATSGAWWWTRTGAPHETDTVRADLAHTIKVNGTINNAVVNSATGGVFPAMWVNV